MSTIMMSLSYSNTIIFFPTSSSPPRGMMRSLPFLKKAGFAFFSRRLKKEGLALGATLVFVFILFLLTLLKGRLFFGCKAFGCCDEVGAFGSGTGVGVAGLFFGKDDG